MQKITPFLWFNTQAEEAARFYTSLFKNASINSVSYYGDTFADKKGMAMVVQFTVEGQPFMALNGGPEFSFSPAISFQIDVDTQEELDDLWAKLTEGGEEGQCGWLKDKFGLWWQVTPSVMGEMMRDSDPEKVNRMTAAMMQMNKLDIAELQRAFEG